MNLDYQVEPRRSCVSHAARVNPTQIGYLDFLAATSWRTLTNTMDPKNKPVLGQSLLQPLFHSPATGPIIDTSPQSLGLQDSGPEDLDTVADLSKSGRVRRVVGKTVDKLGRTKSLGGKAQPPSPSSRRMFSLNRGKSSHTPSSP